MNTIDAAEVGGGRVVGSTVENASRQRRKPRRRDCLLLLLLLLSVATLTLADALRFDIPAQPLPEALKIFASQAKMQLLYKSDAVSRGRSNTVVGDFDTREALLLLLKGTGFEVVFSKGNAATIRPVQSASKTISTSALSVTDAGAARPAEDLPTATRTAQADGAIAETLQADAAGIQQIDEVIVLGTLLRSITPTSPVLTLYRDDIERGGYTSTAEIFTKLPQNFSSTSASTSSFGGGNLGATTQIDLRGLGSEATLTLVNGRRISSAAGDEGRGVDVSMIPIAAIERIDILTDGASALYGSDAIGGVVNFVLRDDFDGAQTRVQFGQNSADSDDFQVTQTLGTSWGSGRALAAAQYAKSKPLGYRDIGIDSFDFRSRGGGDQRIPFIGSPGTVLPGGFFFGQPFTSITGPGGQPVFFATLPPGGGQAVDVNDLGLNELIAGSLGLGEFVPEQENISGYLTLEQELGSVTLFADGVFAHRAADIATGVTGDYLFVPSTNAFSPFDEDVFVAYLFNDLGSLENTVERDGWFANAGARGNWGASDWTWEVVGTLSEDESETRFVLPDPSALAVLLGSSDPAVAFNPFGDGSAQSAATIEAVKARFRNVGRTSMNALSMQTQGSLWQMPGGSARLALGAQYHEEELETFGQQNSTIIAGANASREVEAVFGELYVPFVGRGNAHWLLQELAFSAAVRHERYGDRFGETTNPKLGILWRPAQDLVFKASWGTSFRAPSLRELYGRTTSGLAGVVDPNAPGGPAMAFPLRTSGGNPNLVEESAETYTVSGEYQPQWLEGARLSLSRFHIDYEDRIRGLLDGLTLSTILQLEDSLPPGIITRDAAGRLTTVNATNINSASTLMSGFDLMAGYSWTTQRSGNFDISAAATLYSHYEDELLTGVPVFDLQGTVGNPPEWRGRAGLTWLKWPWSAMLSVYYIPGLHNDDADPGIVLREVDSQTTVDVQLGFSSPARAGWLRGFTVRLGAKNLLDEPPPFVDGQQRRGLDIRNHVVDGRTIYLNLSKGFGAAVSSRTQK